MAKGQHWLEAIELIFLGLVLLSLGWALPNDQWGLPLFLLWISLCFNLVNRLNLRRRQRRQIVGTVKHLEQKLQTQIDEITAQVRRDHSIKNSIAQLKSSEEMRTYLESLETSITNVVQYLNKETLGDRLKHLEQEIIRFQQQDLETQLLPSLQKVADSVPDPWKNPEHYLAQQTHPGHQWHCIHILNAHRDCVSTLDISADGRLLASGSWDQHIKIWAIANGTQVTQAKAHNQGLLELLFTGHNNQSYHLASSSFEPDIKLWLIEMAEASVPKLELKHTLKKHREAVYGLAVTADGRYLLSGGHDQTLCQWSTKSGELILSNNDPGDQIQVIAVTPKGNVFLSGGKEGIIKFWQSSDHQLLGSLGSDQPDAIEAIAVRADGELFASGGESGIIYLWDLNLNTFTSLPDSVPCVTIAAHSKAITHLAFAHQGNFLISGSVDGSIKIWQPGNDTPLSSLNLNDPEQGEMARLLSLTLSPDDGTLVAGGSDGRIKIWQQQ